MTTMKQERTLAEKRFWQAIRQVAAESGLKSGWVHLGTPCSIREVADLMDRFQEDRQLPGFYGIRIPMGDIGGLTVSLLIENQRELIIGIQVEQQDDGLADDLSFETYQGILQKMSASQHGWNFDSPGWLAWKTPAVRLDFRSRQNKAFQDIIRNRDNSEALYLISEEISDIIRDMSEMVLDKEKAKYGAVVN